MRKKPQCQVEGCLHELPPDRIYHKRYKICVYHATLSSLLLDGEQVRFCQQCGRFQPLTDFEDNRKSCMKALEAHNEQRRRARVKARELAGCPPRRRQVPRKRSHSDCSGGTSGGTPNTAGFVESDSMIPPPQLPVGPAASAPAAMAPMFPGFVPAAPDVVDPFDGIDIEALMREGADLSGSGGLTPRAGGLPLGVSASMSLPMGTVMPSPWGLPMSMSMSVPLPYAPARPPTGLGPMLGLNQLAAAQLATLQSQASMQQRMAAMMHPALARWAQAQGAFAAGAVRAPPSVSPFMAAGAVPFGAGMPSQLQAQPTVPRKSTDSTSSLMPLTVNDLLNDAAL